MALMGTIALVILLVGFRLLLPPVPSFAALFRRWGRRTSLICCSIALVLAAVVILASR